MSKTSLCIQMLEILSSKRIVKISELASILETNPRNILEYKKEIENAGYTIDSIPGRYGGYLLNTKKVFLSANLDKNEEQAILEGTKYLLSRNDFMNWAQYSKAIYKVISNFTYNLNRNVTIIYRFPLAMPQDEINERYAILDKAISIKHKVRINYETVAAGAQPFLINPYKLFMYNNAWFCIALDNASNMFRHYKLNRIISFELIDEPFKHSYLYEENEHIDQHGFKYSGDSLRIKLEFHGVSKILLAERIYGKNQEIEEVDGKLIFTVTMRNFWEIKKFVLGYGSQVKVLEPESLRIAVQEEIAKLQELYV